MKPAKLGFLLAFFIFCSLITPGLSGIAKLMKLLCDEYKDICSMDMDPGNCYEPQFKFFYNRTAKECQGFIFNGCDGNLNNFNLKLECDVACNEDYRTVRKLEPEPEPELESMGICGYSWMGHLKQRRKKIQVNVEIFGKCP